VFYYFVRWLFNVNKKSLASSAIMVTSAAGPIGMQVVQQLIERSDVNHIFACVAGQDDRSELEIMGPSVS
jgi:FlaA1/EpsC-like NDP-sugar epimerase